MRPRTRNGLRIVLIEVASIGLIVIAVFGLTLIAVYLLIR
jgi:hypothetical protein